MAINPYLSGNGSTLSPTVEYNPNNSFFTVNTYNSPGLVSVGTFPSNLAPYSLTTSSQSLIFPYRGSKNYKHSPSTNAVGIIGISSVGLKIESARSNITRVYKSKTWTLDHVKSDLIGIDQYGGYVNSAGDYRYVNGSFIKTTAWSGTFPFNRGWRHRSGLSFLHSFLLGYAADGYPIYGPYGTDDPLNPESPYVILRSGYKLAVTSDRPPSKTVYVNGNFVNSTAILLFTSRDLGIGMVVTGTGIPDDTKIKNIIGQTIYLTKTITINSGNFLNCFYPPGYFCEDYVYDTSNNPHLDIHNGRFCITPDYPEGTYAYFLTVDSALNPIYPYFIGPTYYGRLTADSTNTNLTIINVSSGTLSPPFNTAIRSYNLFLPYQNTNVNISASTEDPKSQIYPYQIFTHNKLNSNQNFNVTGLTVNDIEPFQFVIKAEYENTGTYQVNINRLPSTDNLLLNIEVADFLISPSFNPSITLYTITVPNSLIGVPIKITAADNSSLITVNGKTHISGTQVRYATEEGINEFDIIVTAQNGSTRLYNLDISRLNNDAFPISLSIDPPGLLPQFDQNIFYYNYNLPFSTSTVSLTPIISNNSTTITINNIPTPNLTIRTISNIPEGYSLISSRTQANDTNVQFLYRILVRRANDPESRLVSLNLSRGTLTPDFTSTTYVYTATIANTVTSLTITPIGINTGSIILIDNQTLDSGSISLPIPLQVGQNIKRLSVLGSDRSSSSTYILNLIRNQSNISTLSDLKILGYPLKPTFASTAFTYVSTVSNWVASTYIIPVATEPNAIINVNNLVVQSGLLSQEIPLNIGLNTATIKVISQDNTSTSTYTLRINRLLNAENRLKYAYSSSRPAKAYHITRTTDPVEIAKLLANGWVYIRDDIYALRRIPFTS